jgi:hypothetical protein
MAIALRARPEWTGDPVLTIDGTSVRVVACPTPLAARGALHDRSGAERLVLLTELTDIELGDSILALLSHNAVRGVEPWDLVRQAFGGDVSLDSALTRVGRWLADALTDLAPPDGWPAPIGTTVTREHALRHLAARLLGLSPAALDIAGLLQWTTDATAQLRFKNLPAATADGITAFLVECAGPAATPVLAAVRAGHGVDAIPLGLLAGVFWSEKSGADREVDVAVARTRLEPRFGGTRLNAVQAAEFLKSTEAWAYRAIDAGERHRGEAVRMLHRAEAIAAELDICHRLGTSALLPSGFTARMRSFADAVRFAVPAGGQADPDAVVRAQTALGDVEGHRDPTTRHRVETARMAVRLLRWLTAHDGPAPATLYDALLRQVREDGWVDRARLDIFAGDPDPRVAEAYRLLHRAIAARRARHDQRFATLLAEATAAETEPGSLLRVEDVLDRVVQPILDNGRRVLLLVMDGMSIAGATELAESITRGTTWLELTPGGGPRTGVLAALPTVTATSRCSLLSGRIAVGDQRRERAAFAARYPDGVLLHKAGLRSAAGDAVAPEVAAALDDPNATLVAAVVNTVDDALDRSDPGSIVWGTDTINAVRDLLAVVRDRVVILVSDHGHVIDRGEESVSQRGTTSDNRWRPATPPAGDGELAFSGSRVALGGGSVVLPWREELRYGPRKAGYHGGASQAEVVTPLVVFDVSDDAVPGWAGAPVASPEWWRERLTTPEITTSLKNRRLPKPRSAQDPSLFDDLLPVEVPAPAVLTPGVPAAARPGLVEALLASDVYAQRRDTRAPLPDQRVAALIETLLAGGGRATLDTLAARARIPAHRIGGTVTALRRLLQVEGYPVVTLDPDGVTVLLNQELMVEQFQLDRP